MNDVDESILRKLLERNEQALEEIRYRYGHYLTVIARNIVGNDEDAEECSSPI